MRTELTTLTAAGELVYKESIQIPAVRRLAQGH